MPDEHVNRRGILALAQHLVLIGSRFTLAGPPKRLRGRPRRSRTFNVG